MFIRQLNILLVFKIVFWIIQMDVQNLIESFYVKNDKIDKEEVNFEYLYTTICQEI